MRYFKAFFQLLPFCIIPFYLKYLPAEQQKIDLVMAVYLLGFVSFLLKHALRLIVQQKLPAAVGKVSVNFNFFGISKYFQREQLLSGLKLILVNIFAVFMLTIVPLMFFIFVSFILGDITDPSCNYQSTNNGQQIVCDDNTIDVSQSFSSLFSTLRNISLTIWLWAAGWYLLEAVNGVFIQQGYKQEEWGFAIGDSIQNIFAIC